MKPPADVERLKETLNFAKVVGITIVVAHSYRQMEDVMHHACLKNILEELIVVDSATRFNLKNPPFTGCMSVRVETFQDLAFASKKYRNHYFVFAGLPFLNPESEFFKAWTQSCHNGVAMLDRRFARIDGTRNLFEASDDMKAEFRWRR